MAPQVARTDYWSDTPVTPFEETLRVARALGVSLAQPVLAAGVKAPELIWFQAS